MRDAEKRLVEATQASREDLGRLCELLRKVVRIFTAPEAASYDMEGLRRVVAMAEVSHKRLGEEVRAFHQKLEAEDLMEKLNQSQSNGRRHPGEPASA